MEKILRTNSKAFTDKANKYILEAIDLEGYDQYDQDKMTEKEQLQAVHTEFLNTHQYLVDQIGENKAFTEWLMGLPGLLNIDFYNYEILKIAIEWKSLRFGATEKQEDAVIDNWFPMITTKFFKLLRGNV